MEGVGTIRFADRVSAEVSKDTLPSTFAVIKTPHKGSKFQRRSAAIDASKHGEPWAERRPRATSRPINATSFSASERLGRDTIRYRRSHGHEDYVQRPDGKDASGYLARPGRANAPGVVVIQEWWGLQDQIKGICDRLAWRDTKHWRRISLPGPWCHITTRKPPIAR